MTQNPTHNARPEAAPRSPLHRPAHHESGAQHVTGRARYIDDLPDPPGAVWCAPVVSPIARGRIVSRDATAARAMPGVRAVLFGEDVPGRNLIGAVIHDEPVLATEEVFAVGQAVALVVADDPHLAAKAAAAVAIEYAELPAILSIEAAIAAEAYIGVPHVIARGDLEAAFAQAAHVVEGTMRTGAQDHFYLETHAALVWPEEAGCFKVFSSTQHPSEVQREIAAVLGIGAHRVVCEVPRMGGGFGGKESQASPFACMAALAAWHTGRPARIWLERGQDMAWTGKRHPFESKFRAAFGPDGAILGLDVQLYCDAGWSADLSLAILDRGLFHLDSSFFIPAVRYEGRACRTNTPSNTAFRGFGGPQGMFVTDEIINRASEALGLDPALVRLRNFYGPPMNPAEAGLEGAPLRAADPGARDRTHYGQQVKHNRLPRIARELLTGSRYAARRAEIEAFNATSPWVKRGIGFQPVKFGISFTKGFLNQAGALVLIYPDGTVQLNHGGTEMGQGLHTKMAAVCAHELGVRTDAVRVMHTSTEKVPNTSATAASSGSDLNGQAVREACATLRGRLRPVAAGMLGVDASEASRIEFEGGYVGLPGGNVRAFSDVCTQAWLQQVSLSSTGFYRTPGINYDPVAGRGEPFYYFAFGGAVCEVELNGLTGEHRLTRVDILHDVGASLVPTIDRGQVEGAFAQGYGWLTCEEVLFDAKGHCKTTGPSTYKIPAVGDMPLDFFVNLLDDAPQPGVIGGSKAVGEPPFMLGIAAITALRHGISAFGPGVVSLASPATPEALLRAIEAQRGRQAAS